jgi:hypothetical protein
MNFAYELCDRYIAVWNERDPKRRRAMVAELWAPDGDERHRAYTCCSSISTASAPTSGRASDVSRRAP